ncbi:MAG: 1-acyl-sn-glycerol-3-phosphate acyltransferase [Acidimicrobiales bacterium]|nr:1-acyl-sn-glycerol-3-phosphate acyltransferase [Acidimicrobiales bacterium]
MTFDFSVGHSTLKAKWARRAKTIPALFIAFFITWMLLPVLVSIVCIHDLLRDRTFARTRLTLFGAWWLAMELLGVLAAFFLWLVFAPPRRLGSATSLRFHSHLQQIWARSLAFGAKYAIGFRWSVEGIECLRPSGPLIVLARHGSQGDALLTAALLTKAGRRLRFVLKRQLLSDPCLDVVGHRMPNYFVDRDSSDNHQELSNINLLAADLDDDEALVIFPEGTRFSPAKLVNAVVAVAETAPARTATIMNLRSVLPLRTAGTLAALEATDADIVVCNHVGIDDISSLSQLREAVPLRRPLKFKLWRTCRSEVPPRQPEDELVNWLDHQWSDVDDWVTRNQ